MITVKQIEQKNPCLYQINTRVFLFELSRALGRKATLKDIPDRYLDQLQEQGFAYVYFLSVWQTGEFGKNVSRSKSDWIEGFARDLSDFKQDDICGSGFAITDYSLNREFGDASELSLLQNRLHQRGMKLILDLVPNHTACDHPWVKKHPEFYIQGDEAKLKAEPRNYIKIDDKIFAYGRDPYFDGWPDTLQLNYANKALQEKMFETIESISSYCDGLRCDMAMLILPHIFERTWHLKMAPFWSKAVALAKEKKPDFIFMAEVYWDLEWELQQEGFNFTYDKKLYDRLRGSDAGPVREHLWADMPYQIRSARFLENHDEPRAASIFFQEKEKAAAVVTFLTQGLRFFYDGQLEGAQKRVSVHVQRREKESENSDLKHFYQTLLEVLKLPVVHDSNWQLSNCSVAWAENWTHDAFISFKWTAEKEKLNDLLVVVNFSNHQSQCLVKFPLSSSLDNSLLVFEDLFGTEIYERQKSDIESKGLFVDLKPWGYNVFAIRNK
ncbi:MAG: alpha-amylase [Cyanobacteria bacterium TGS_CYA1]|nr:alpha-amylase [Cyanobacteria bacterium TGS_CYA1]